VKRPSRQGRPTVAIVGLGLVGGSLARALTRVGYRVVGVDRPPVLRRARAARAIAVGRSLAAAVSEAQVVVLAAPPLANLRLLRALARPPRPVPVITDVGSVKGAIVAEARRLGLENFVGGHPMAGTERSGFAASSTALFRGRSWILTPSGSTPRALRVVRALVRAVGARPLVMPPADHDRAAAFLSHAPQIVSWALLAGALGDPVARRHLRMAGPGFHDMTRLAASPRALWREILAQNDREIALALARLVEGLGHAGPKGWSLVSSRRRGARR
jgi:prephenate dehydrogenase